MNKREDDILRYISNEMNEEEKKRFEQQLAGDKQLREEVEGLMATQKALQNWPEGEFEAPALSTLESGSKPSPLKSLSFRKWMGYAAAVLLLLTFAWISDLQIAQKDNALILSFGPLEEEASYDSEQVAQIVDEAVGKYVAQTQKEETINAKKLEWQLAEMEEKMTGRLVRFYQKESNKVKQQLSDHERKQLLATEQLVRGLQLEQRVVLQEAILAVLDQLEQQRLEDRIDVKNAFQQINALLADLQEGGAVVAGNDLEVRHY